MNEQDLLNVTHQLNNPDDADTTPYPLIDEQGTINVVGDANKTEIKAGTYTMTFRVPFVNEETNSIEYKTVKKTYENIFITPRLDPILTDAVIKLKALMYKNEGGKMVELTAEEQRLEMASVDRQQAVMDIFCDIAAAFLRIDPELKEYMAIDDVMDVTKRVFDTYPEMIKSGNSFFTGLPQR